MVVASLAKGRITEMRDLLATMNFEPGIVNPENSLAPFGELKNLHFARFVLLDDQTHGDLAAYRIERPEPPLYLAFLGDYDGDYDQFLRDLTAAAAPGLRRIFSLCEGFSAAADLVDWMKKSEHRPSTYYCNWVGRTTKQCREEERLRLSLSAYIRDNRAALKGSPHEIRKTLRRFVDEEKAAGRLTLTPAEATPASWTLRHACDIATLVFLVAFGVLTLPLTIVPLLIVAFKLRSLETSDPVIAPPPDPRWVARLAVIEDHDVSNQFSAMGYMKPGIFRRLLLTSILWVIDLTARVIYTKGRLARVATIHFARWVYLDGNARLFFASNYDGSLESYMDDFINKVSFGLNVVFSNGIGYPKTDWLLFQGAKNEQLFKYFLRRHQLPTEVWYNGHAGFRVADLERNSRIRQGLEAPVLTERATREWIALL